MSFQTPKKGASMNEYETWSNEDRQITLFTKNPEVARVFRKLVWRLTTYERNGKVFAWQCCIPVEKLGFVEMQIKKNLSIENKQVTGEQKDKFRFKEINPIRAIHSDTLKGLHK